MIANPDLTDDGLGFNSLAKSLSKNVAFTASRNTLAKNVREFEKACRWVSQIKKRKTINVNASSYGVKHVAEADIGHVTNGAFIAAALFNGFEMKREKGLNPIFNMSEKSIRTFRQRIDAKRQTDFDETSGY